MAKNIQWALYENNRTKLKILQQIQDLEGELPEDLEAALNAAEGERDDLLEDGIATYKNLGGMVELHAAEIKRLTERKKALEARQETLEKWLGNAIGEGVKWERGVHRLSWLSSTQVEAELEKLPLEYIRTKYEPDKKLLKTELEAGAVIDGAKLVTKNNLQVK